MLQNQGLSQEKKTTKTTGTWAQAMASQTRTQMEKSKDDALYELIKKPRSKEYIRLVTEYFRKAKKVRELENQIEGLKQGSGKKGVQAFAKGAEGASASEREELKWFEGTSSEHKPQTEPQVTATRQNSLETPELSSSEVKWFDTVSIKETPKTEPAESKWYMEDVDKPQTQTQKNSDWTIQTVIDRAPAIELEKMQQELEALKQELVDINEKLEQELPVGDAKLGMLYDVNKEAELMRRGYISRPGKPVNSEDALINEVRPRDETEERQWRKAYRLLDETYEMNEQNLLCLEIYRTMLCKVYEDGTCSVIRN